MQWRGTRARAPQLALADVFRVLEEQKRSGGVEEYSFSQTTLEQVFLAFAKRQMAHDEGEGAAIN